MKLPVPGAVRPRHCEFAYLARYSARETRSGLTKLVPSALSNTASSLLKLLLMTAGRVSR
jgi:hypothetical protein